MKRVWKPLDVGGLRLYKVLMRFHAHPQWDKVFIVASDSPSGAAYLIEQLYAETEWTDEEPSIAGFALNIYQPASWWENGISKT